MPTKRPVKLMIAQDLHGPLKLQALQEGKSASSLAEALLTAHRDHWPEWARRGPGEDPPKPPRGKKAKPKPNPSPQPLKLHLATDLYLDLVACTVREGVTLSGLVEGVLRRALSYWTVRAPRGRRARKAS